MFTEVFAERLALHDIRLISVIEQMLENDGSTIESLFDKNGKLNQVLMPQAVDSVRKTLGIHLDAAARVLGYSERRISQFASVKRVQNFGVEWTQFELAGEPRYITQATIAREVFAPLVKITVATTLDDSSFPSGSYEFRGPADDPKAVVTIPIEQFAKKIMFCAEMGFLGEHDVDLFERTSALSRFGEYRKTSLFALRDQLLKKDSISVVAGEMSVGKHKKITR